MSGNPVPHTAKWQGRSRTMTLTAWAGVTGKSRGYFDHRLHKQSLQEILDGLSSPSFTAIDTFLYGGIGRNEE